MVAGKGDLLFWQDQVMKFMNALCCLWQTHPRFVPVTSCRPLALRSTSGKISKAALQYHCYAGKHGFHLLVWRWCWRTGETKGWGNVVLRKSSFFFFQTAPEGLWAVFVQGLTQKGVQGRKAVFPLHTWELNRSMIFFLRVFICIKVSLFINRLIALLWTIAISAL